nr:IclR family transcriptional regulator C-terminal domain-containing protein [Paracoccus bogoriensis]
MVYATRLQSKREAFFATLVGHSVPVTGSSGGWAALALLPDAEIDAILARAPLRALTPRSLTDPDAIRAQIAAVRRDGHALALEQVLMGEVAIAMAISDPQGRPVGAVHIAGSLAEWQPEDFRRRMAPPLAAAIRSLRAA